VSTDQTAARLYNATEAADQRVVDAVGAVASRTGLSRAQVSLAWLFGQPGITSPIIGATRMEHLADAVRALAVRLDPEDIAAVEAEYVPHARSFLE
jgi:aryl-alcohol dehydrogenase-like predicted oxidoreductase